MNEDYIVIGSAPNDEDCVQVSTKTDYIPAMRKECERFRELLRKKFGNEPSGARLSIKKFYHDFGAYYEVVCYYEDNNDTAREYAFKLENECPDHWE